MRAIWREVGRFARLETWQFRMLRACLPGPFTFLLPRDPRDPAPPAARASAAPSACACPTHPVPQLLLAELGEPLMSSTLLLRGRSRCRSPTAREIRERLEHQIDAILDGGDCGIEPTTVVDLSVTPPVIVRAGKGELGLITGRAL